MRQGSVFTRRTVWPALLAVLAALATPLAGSSVGQCPMEHCPLASSLLTAPMTCCTVEPAPATPAAPAPQLAASLAPVGEVTDDGLLSSDAVSLALRPAPSPQRGQPDLQSLLGVLRV
jgi:hypothetical protein